jgi:peptidoglycan hydrolase-like protein with peptidoglycan-binding domain
VAVLGIAAALGVAIAIPVVLLRGGGNEPAATPLPESTPTATTPASTETSPSTTTTAPETTTTTPSTTTTTPSESAATTFSLPEGTKLKLGEGDPAIVQQLQQALSSAGYDPGSADGTFGPQTEAAVVAFQQANGLTADGTVGPLTASALASAIATG